MVLSNTPPKRPPDTPNPRVTLSAHFRTRRSSERCCGRRSSWWRERNSGRLVTATARGKSVGDRQRLLHDNHAGTIEAVDASLLHLLLDAGRLPVPTVCN